MSRNSKKTKERCDRFLEAFAKENEEVRREIAAAIPTYNELLNMRARSFSEFALRDAAVKLGVGQHKGIIDYKNIIPPCPNCGEVEQIKKKVRSEREYYCCESCGLSYVANWNSISYGAKTTSLEWLKVLHCLLDHYSIDRTCSVTGISRNSYYYIRNRLFYGMELALKDIRLYGTVQCDTTFVYANYRGSDLGEVDVPEGSEFDVVDYKPRPARARGGENTHKDSGTNTVCIFVAIDDRGHLDAKFVCLGSANQHLLEQAIGKDKILLTVPEKDPSPYSQYHKASKNPSPPGSASLLVSDKEKAIEAFARKYGIMHEAHVYRKKGKQLWLQPGNHNIQRINAAHKRLKEFLSRASSVSSKYLPGFLTFFSWIENTGATPEAIDRLFSILSEPGLGKDAEFFKERFAVPNYMSQWSLDPDNPLKKFSYNKLYAYYLYKQRKDLIDAGKMDEAMPLREIASMTGYSEQGVRRNFKNLFSSGLDSLIMEKFTPKNKEMKLRKSKVVSPEMIALYDEFAENMLKAPSERLSLSQFVDIVNKRNGTKYSINKFFYSFQRIIDTGIRPSYRNSAKLNDFGILTPGQKRAHSIYLEYQKAQKRMRSSGFKPKLMVLRKQMAEKFGMTEAQFVHLLTIGAKAQKLLDQWANKSENSQSSSSDE